MTFAEIYQLNCRIESPNGHFSPILCEKNQQFGCYFPKNGDKFPEFCVSCPITRAERRSAFSLHFPVSMNSFPLIFVFNSMKSFIFQTEEDVMSFSVKNRIICNVEIILILRNVTAHSLNNCKTLNHPTEHAVPSQLESYSIFYQQLFCE